MARAIAYIRRIMALRSGVVATAHTLLANVLILGINFGTGVITARVLEPAGRGELAVIILWPQFLTAATSIGLPSALLYNLRRYPERASQIFAAALPLGVIMGGIATMVGILLIPWWLTEYSPEVMRFAQWMMVLSPLVLLNLAFTFVVQAREEYAIYNAVRYLNSLLTLLALGPLVLIYHLTPFNAAIAYMLPTIPIFLWMLVRLWRIYRPALRGWVWSFRRLLSYGARSYGIDLLGQLSLQLDRVLVAALLDPAAMGLYVVALSLSQILNVFPASVISILFPKASGRSVEEVASLTGRAARGSIVATVLVALGLVLFGPWALGLLYGQEYLEAIPVLTLLLFQVVIGSTAWVLDQAFMAANRPGVVTIMQGVGLGLAVPLLLVLVPRYGLEGAGLALLISAVIRFALAVASFPLVLKVRPPRLWPTRDDLAAISALRYRNK